MREYKFRVWDKERKEILPVKLMDFSEWWVSCDPTYGKAKPLEHGERNSFKNQSADRHILMQYTGLKDKNGKEIYEGDIVVRDGYIWFDDGTPNYRGTVEWIYSQWQVIAHCVNPDKQGISNGINEGLNDEGIDEGENSDWIVIGNIYENVDLLTDRKQP